MSKNNASGASQTETHSNRLYRPLSRSAEALGSTTVSKGRRTLRRRLKLPALLLVAMGLLFAQCVTGPAVGGDEKAPRTPPAITRQQVARWVDDLGADSRQTRVEAEQQLIQAGPAVLPLLPPAETIGSEAARQSLLRVRAAIEQRQVEQSLDGSQVSLEGTVRLAEIANEIAEQTGNRIVVPADMAEHEVQVSLHGASFWEALDQVARLAGQSWRVDAAAVVLTDNAAEAAQKNVGTSTQAGPFRVTARVADLKPIAGSPDENLLRFEVSLLAEPRLKPLFLVCDANAIAATTMGEGQEHSLPAFNPRARQEVPFGTGSRDATIRLDYRVRQDMVPTRVRLQGRLEAEVATRQERFAFDDATADPRQLLEQGGLTVALQQTRLTRQGPGTALEVRCHVRYDSGGPAFESHRTWVFHNDAHLLLADGSVHQHAGGFETRLQRDGVIELVYRFENLPADPGAIRFVYVAPTIVARVPIEFELADIPTAGPAVKDDR